MRRARVDFPSAPQAAIILLAHFLLQYLLGAVLHDFGGVLNLTESQAGALVVLVANGIVLTAVMHYRGVGYGDILHPSRSGLVSTTVLLVPPLLLVVPLVILLDISVVGMLERILPVSRWEEQAFGRMADGSLPEVVLVCVLAPVLEEMLFRGVLLQAFLHRYPRWPAILVSALLFGAAHLNIYQFVLAFCVGLLLGWIFERSRSLVPCIALHAALNTSVAMLAGSAAEAPEPALAYSPLLTWSLALAAAGVGAWLLRTILAYKPLEAPTEAINPAPGRAE